MNSPPALPWRHGRHPAREPSRFSPTCCCGPKRAWSNSRPPTWRCRCGCRSRMPASRSMDRWCFRGSRLTSCAACLPARSPWCITRTRGRCRSRAGARRSASTATRPASTQNSLLVPGWASRFPPTASSRVPNASCARHRATKPGPFSPACLYGWVPTGSPWPPLTAIAWRCAPSRSRALPQTYAKRSCRPAPWPRPRAWLDRQRTPRSSWCWESSRRPSGSRESA